MTGALFEELGRRGHEPLLEKISGTIRFEIVDGKQTERWLVSIDKGDVSVSRKNVRADCTLRADKVVFDRVASGQMNAMAATLRGDIALEGDSELLVPFQRLLPGPPRRRRKLRSTAAADDHERRPGQDPRRQHLRGQRTRGDIEASLTDPTGLFSFDTRFLSKWVLTVNGERLNPLSVDDLQYFETRFFLVPGTGTVYVDSKLSVIRQRAVGDGFHEELTILNHDEKPVDLTVRIDAGCDFADLFEVKDALAKKGKYRNRVERGGSARLRARHVRPRDVDLGNGPRAARQGRPDLQGHDRAARRVDDRPGRRHGDAGLRRAARAPEVRARPRPAEHGAEPGAVARRTRRGSSATGIRSRRPTGAASSTWPRCASPARRRRAKPARCRPAVVHDDVRPRQHLHQPAGAAVHSRAGGDDAARARRLAGNAGRRLSRRGSRPDPPRDALRRADGVRGAAALALLRLRRRDAALRRAARRVRALDRRPEARSRASSTRPGRR